MRRIRPCVAHQENHDADRPATERPLNAPSGPRALTFAVALLVGCADAAEEAPPAAAPNPAAEHLSAALEASGAEHYALLARLCTQATGTELRASGGTFVAPPDSLPTAPGASDGWVTRPVRVFDNLYFVGQTRYSAWAVTTSEGIIVIDPLFDYSVRGAVEGGLRQLGLDPASIRYVIVSHGHSDHAGGARYLQDTYGARVVLAPADWDLLERTGGDWPKPRRDVEATDGMELTLGETTLVLHHTPGHTPGTLSTIIPVTDGDQRHVAALWGGTAFNFMGGGEEARWFEEYIDSAERFAQVSRAAGADVMLSNHPQYDGTTTKLDALAARAPGGLHPYVMGPEGVARYLAVAASCARAGLAGVG